MNIAGRIATALLLLPVAEIVIFILVAVAAGFWTALLLVTLTSVLGALLLRFAGQVHLRRLRGSLADGVELTADAAGTGLSLVLAGILLLVPGFITDALALLVLLPATRRWMGSFISASLASVMKRQPGEPGVVDLDPDEWQRHGDQPPSGSSASDTPRSLQEPRRG
jgi:UPF0716 protein FxsA